MNVTLVDELKKVMDKIVPDSDIEISANRKVYQAIKAVQLSLSMELLESYYETNGNFEAHFARFGVGKVEMSLYGNVDSSEIELVWDIKSLEGYVRKKFYTPHLDCKTFYNMEDMVVRVKSEVEYLSGEKIVLEAPRIGKSNIMTFYTKSHTVSVWYSVSNLPNSLLVGHFIQKLTLSERKVLSIVG